MSIDVLERGLETLPVGHQHPPRCDMIRSTSCTHGDHIVNLKLPDRSGHGPFLVVARHGAWT
jgi:hypothetical protein